MEKKAEEVDDDKPADKKTLEKWLKTLESSVGPIVVTLLVKKGKVTYLHSIGERFYFDKDHDEEDKPLLTLNADKEALKTMNTQLDYVG